MGSGDINTKGSWIESSGLKAHREAEQKIIQAQQKIQPELEVVETMTAEEKIKKEREDGLKLHRAAEEKILQAQRESGAHYL